MAIQGYWAAFFKSIAQAGKYNALLNPEFETALGAEWSHSTTGVTRVALHPQNIGHSIEVVDDGTGKFLEQTVMLERKIKGAVANDGGAQTDETAAAQNTTANDMTLLPASPVVGDAYYFGFELPTDRFRLDIGTAGAGTWTITWEYWNGETWAALTGVTDGTTGFTVAGENNVSWVQPLDWVETTVLGISAYWVRARLSAFTSSITSPVGTQAWWHPSARILNAGAYVKNITPAQSAMLTLDQLNSAAISVKSRTYSIAHTPFLPKTAGQWGYRGTYDTIHPDCTQVKIRFSSAAVMTYYIALARLMSLNEVGGAHGLEAASEYELVDATTFAHTNSGTPWRVFKMGLRGISATASSFYRTRDGKYSGYLQNDERLYLMFFRHYGALRDRVEAWGKITGLTFTAEPAVMRRNLTIQLEKDWVEIAE